MSTDLSDARKGNAVQDRFSRGGGPIKILVVEDNPGDAYLLQETLKEAADSNPTELKLAETFADALRFLNESKFDVVLSDLSLPDSRGMETFTRLYARAPQTPIILLTGLENESLGLEAEIDALSERYRYMRSAVVVGRGLNYANAFEFALKLMETCYVVAERFSSADFLHGPIALVEPSFPVFAFAPTGVTWPSIGETLRKLKGLKAEIVAIADPTNREVDAMATRVIRLPRHIPEVLTPIPYIVPAQIFAACLAAQKGLDPDRPRTLHKVTLTL